MNEGDAPKSPVKTPSIEDTTLTESELRDKPDHDVEPLEYGQIETSPGEGEATLQDSSHSSDALTRGECQGDASQCDGHNDKFRNSVHDRSPSLSVQSKMRSDSFRRTSNATPRSPSATVAPFPSLSPDSEQMSEIYRKQAVRVEELERENKRLEKEKGDGEAKWLRGEEELEKLREASGEASVLKMQAKKAAEAQSEISQLKAKMDILQRQAQQRDHSRSMSKQIRLSSVLSQGESAGSPDSSKKELESRDSTIAEMELEMARLRGRLSSKTNHCDAHGSQIAALQDSLRSTEQRLGQAESELVDYKKALSRASEKAVKEGFERTSSDTKTKALERGVTEASTARDEAVKKLEHLEKKIETMTKLHKEAEARHTSKLSAAEAQAREASVLKARLTAVETENRRVREERQGRKKRVASAGDDDGLDELEDEDWLRLERRVRELEGENFDLRRGVWRERRNEMEVNAEPSKESAGGDFDEVDLSGSGPASGRRSISGAQGPQVKHSTFSTVLNSGLAAFRGSPDAVAKPRSNSLLQEFDEDDTAFDEEAFALAQREEEARKMAEHVRDVKRKLQDWAGWRLDLVDARKSVAGMQGTGLGEVFEV
jgi:hypothetical protein